MKEVTREWLELASLDLESIKLLILNDRLTNQVAFHAQQAIEKSLKAIIEESGGRVPKIHSLSKLIEMCTVFISLTVNDDVVIALDSLYLESRYPGDLGLLPDGKPTIQQAEIFNVFAQEIFQQVKNYLY